ncbi:MAG: dicarboxylate/amino acid:cation symporter [Planctomycetia bacterium]|nr:dicarboxylate/amino acid:cation symporter [Planctomycetia bacterium]
MTHPAQPGAAPPDALPPDSPRRRLRLPLHVQITLGLLLGAILGLSLHAAFQIPVVPDVTFSDDEDRTGVDDRLEWVAKNIAEPAGKVFLRLMFMVVIPLIFSALALAVVNMGDLRRLGWVGLKTLLFTGGFSLTAVAVGVLLVGTFKPGKTLTEDRREALLKQYAEETGKKLADAKKAKPILDTLLDIIPENPFQEIVGAIDGSSKGNGMLAVMFFALACGVAMTTVPQACEVLVKWLEGFFALSMQIIKFAMYLAPYGAGCLVFALCSRLGLEILVTLFWFVLVTLAGLAFHLLVVYSVVIGAFGGMSPWRFFARVREAMLVAFSTSSSNASLPTALKVAEERLRLKPEVSRFVLTVGATGNQNGTALYEGVVVLFLAQVYGVELSLTEQVRVVLFSVLAGIGTAGVPGGSLPLIVVLMQSVGVPAEGIGIILGVDRILDMCRTVVNVTGDLAVATCVSRREEAPAADTAVAT